MTATLDGLVTIHDAVDVAKLSDAPPDCYLSFKYTEGSKLNRRKVRYLSTRVNGIGELSIKVLEYEGNNAHATEKYYKVKHCCRVIYLAETGFSLEGAQRHNGDDPHTRDPPGLTKILEDKFQLVWNGEYDGKGDPIYVQLEFTETQQDGIIATLAKAARSWGSKIMSPERRKAGLSLLRRDSDSSATEHETRMVLYNDKYEEEEASEQHLPGPRMPLIDNNEDPEQVFMAHEIKWCFKQRIFWARKSVEAFVYEIDDDEIVNIMNFKITQDIPVTLILNKKAWDGSSCKYGPQALNKLFENGVELYLCRPRLNTEGGWASQHSKAMIIDRETLLNGSSNLTTNGFLNNVEHLNMTKNEKIMTKMVRDFEYWKRNSRKVTTVERDQMMAKAAGREAKKLVGQLGDVLQKSPKSVDSKPSSKKAAKTPKQISSKNQQLEEEEEADQSDFDPDASEIEARRLAYELSVDWEGSE